MSQVTQKCNKFKCWVEFPYSLHFTKTRGKRWFVLFFFSFRENGLYNIDQLQKWLYTLQRALGFFKPSQISCKQLNFLTYRNQKGIYSTYRKLYLVKNPSITVNNIEFRERVLISAAYLEMHQKVRWVDGW